MAGSPPRVRGKHQQRIKRRWYPGITPACAGKAARWNIKVGAVRDHPRVCGESTFEKCTLLNTVGSPPRVRGKQDVKKMEETMRGITPACAGKALALKLVCGAIRDHPRVCGESSITMVLISFFSGSPQRLRGKL